MRANWGVHVTVDGQQLDNVYSFEYLGSRVQCDGDEKADVEYRMVIAQSIFNSLSHIWSDHRLSTNMKIRLYIAGVCSAFTHGCEAWSLTDSIKKSINGFNSPYQKRCQRNCVTPGLRPYLYNHETQTPLRWTCLAHGP